MPTFLLDILQFSFLASCVAPQNLVFMRDTLQSNGHLGIDFSPLILTH
jgi:hypothetical protein